MDRTIEKGTRYLSHSSEHHSRLKCQAIIQDNLAVKEQSAAKLYSDRSFCSTLTVIIKMT